MKYCLVFIISFITGMLCTTKFIYAQTSTSPAISQQIPTVDPQIAQEANKYTHYLKICSKPNNPLLARCFGEVIVDDTAMPFTTTKPAGFGPAEFRKAYGVTEEAKKTPVVTIVDAYDQPNKLSDLQTYSSTFNLPQLANCSGAIAKSTTACFKKVDQTGGTKLTLTSSGAYSSESAWSDGGSGCSNYETKPAWQHDTGCKKRTVADVAADADPTSGAAVYDSVKYNNKKGWFKIGGTSLSSPLVAGIFATGDQLTTSQQTDSFIYRLSTNHFHDITKGNNGTCSPSYLCKAAKGYDGPTGLGSPNGYSNYLVKK